MEALITPHQAAKPVRVTTAAELDAVLRSAAGEARARGMLNVIFIESTDHNTISMVVGRAETVLVFTYNNPAYYESGGY